MAAELDTAWTDEAIARYERIEAAQANYRQAIRGLEVTVCSADGTVEVVVAADGELRSVSVNGASRVLNAAILDAVRSANEAAEWARRKLRAEEFAEYPVLGDR